MMFMQTHSAPSEMRVSPELYLTQGDRETSEGAGRPLSEAFAAFWILGVASALFPFLHLPGWLSEQVIWAAGSGPVFYLTKPSCKYA